MSNVKVRYNFETFPESINMPSYDQRFRRYGHWKLEEVLVLDRSGCVANFWTLRPVPNEIWKDSAYEDPRKIYNLSNDG
jgi:hypothetical protein